MSKVIVYTKRDCTYCVQAKRLLESKGVEYVDVEIGTDMTREDFMSIFPNVRTVPFILIDSKQVGGYEDLKEWFANGDNQLLTEG